MRAEYLVFLLVPIITFILLVVTPSLLDDDTEPTLPTDTPVMLRYHYAGETITSEYSVPIELYGEPAIINITIPLPTVEMYQPDNDSYGGYSFLQSLQLSDMSVNASVEGNAASLNNGSIELLNYNVTGDNTLLISYTISIPKVFNNSYVFLVKEPTYSVTVGEKEDVTTSLIDQFEMVNKIMIIFIIAIPLFMAGSFVIHELSDRSERREVLSSHDRDDEEVREMYRSMQERMRYAQEQHHAQRRNAVYKCTELYDDDFRDFSEGDGLFKIGIKKFSVLPFEEQIEIINQLPEVTEFDEKDKEVLLDLGESGTYYVKILPRPKAYRVEPDGRVSCRNPYIHDSDYYLCLGTGQTLYENCYHNKNYSECVRVLIEILRSKHGKGFRTWSQCST